MLILILVAGASAGITYGVETMAANSNAQKQQNLINLLQTQNADLRGQIANSSPPTNSSLLGIDPVAIYDNASSGVVTVEGVESISGSATPVLGSGFVTDFEGTDYIVTNYHVVDQVTDLTVTFSDGDAYQATVKGSDGYSDLAVLSVQAPQSEFHPLQLGSSSSLRVGEPVVAIGNPFGLAGSLTFGVVSQVGRTLSESLAGNFAIADVVQFSAPINPGNSGGPLFSTSGEVVGITTAVVASSQGVGFAIPADTINREIPSLIAIGGYDQHSYMGIVGADMTYQLAALQGTNVTYGVLVQNVTSNGPADMAGLRGGKGTAVVQGTQYSIGGDIVIALNGTKIVNTDALSSYLEEHTLPGDTLALTIIRGGSSTTLNLVLGTRPALPSG
jgi:S1-C subfamily serine protease